MEKESITTRAPRQKTCCKQRVSLFSCHRHQELYKEIRSREQARKSSKNDFFWLSQGTLGLPIERREWLLTASGRTCRSCTFARGSLLTRTLSYLLGLLHSWQYLVMIHLVNVHRIARVSWNSHGTPLSRRRTTPPAGLSALHDAPLRVWRNEGRGHSFENMQFLSLPRLLKPDRAEETTG